MISNHYPMTFNHNAGWIVLMALILITAAIRQYFVQRHFGKNQPGIIVGAIAATIALAYLISPAKVEVSEAQLAKKVSMAQVQSIIETRCSACHSQKNTDDIFTVAQGGVVFNGVASIEQWAPRIKARVIDAKDMPFMNKTQMTDQERTQLAIWLQQKSAK
jgi:uncharacterized membrane protein